MKWQTLSGLLVATTGLASPINPVAARADNPDVYNLRISSETKSLDGRYLTVNGSNEVGLFPTAPVLQVTMVPSGDSGTVELHTYPVGIVDHALAVVGSEGLLPFVEIVNPARSSSCARGSQCDWTSFGVAKDPPQLLTYVRGPEDKGMWVAIKATKNEWTVKWKDAGKGFTTENYIPIQIVYEPVSN